MAVAWVCGSQGKWGTCLLQCAVKVNHTRPTFSYTCLDNAVPVLEMDLGTFRFTAQFPTDWAVPHCCPPPVLFKLKNIQIQNVCSLKTWNNTFPINPSLNSLNEAFRAMLQSLFFLTHWIKKCKYQHVFPIYTWTLKNKTEQEKQHNLFLYLIFPLKLISWLIRNSRKKLMNPLCSNQLFNEVQACIAFIICKKLMNSA